MSDTDRFTIRTGEWPKGLAKRLEGECFKLGVARGKKYSLAEFFLVRTQEYFANRNTLRKGGMLPKKGK